MLQSETPGWALSSPQRFGFWSCKMELCKSSRISEHAGAHLHKTHDRLSLDAVLDHPSLKLLVFWLVTEILLYCQYSFLQVLLCQLTPVPFFRIVWHWEKSQQEEKYQYLQKNCCAEPPQHILLRGLQAWKGTMAGVASNTAEATQKKEKWYCKFMRLCYQHPEVLFKSTH